MTTEDSGIPAAMAEDHPDAELLRLEREIADASATGNAAATDEEAAPFFDLATKLRHELAEIPAHTLDGVIAKFDDYRRIQEGGSISVWDKGLLQTIREGLERLKPSADAALASLWQEYRRNSKEWDKTEEDTAEDERCAKESGEIERQIAATPAQSVLGIAIKLQIADSAHPKDKLATEDSMNLVSAREDAERMSGFEGVVLAGPNAAQIGGAS